jgi:hypothetical protein
MKIVIRLEVSDAVRHALARYRESKGVVGKSDVAKWLNEVCKAAIFSIVEHEDAKRIRTPKRKPKAQDTADA